jgi:hypothetical protein
VRPVWVSAAKLEASACPIEVARRDNLRPVASHDTDFVVDINSIVHVRETHKDVEDMSAAASLMYI